MTDTDLLQNQNNFENDDCQKSMSLGLQQSRSYQPIHKEAALEIDRCKGRMEFE